MKRRKGEACLDWWSLVHVASGVGLAFLGLGVWTSFVLLWAYEGVEGLLRRVGGEGKALFEYESWPNIFMDVVVALLGFAAYVVLRHLGFVPTFGGF